MNNLHAPDLIQRPKVSVVMPTFNSASYVCESINSILAQSYGDWEAIVVDDGSRDGTPDLIKRRYEHEDRVIVHALQINQGAAAARNIGIEAARGRFIAFLDSDDLWRPNKLAIQVPLLEETDACLIYSQYDVIRGPCPTVIRTVLAPELLTYDDLLKGDPIGCLTAIFDTDKTGKVYMPNIRMRQDWGLWMRLLRNGGYGFGVQQTLATLRIHSQSLSANKLRAMYYNYLLLRTEGQLGSIGALWGAGTHAFGAIARRVGSL